MSRTPANAQLYGICLVCGEPRYAALTIDGREPTDAERAYVRTREGERPTGHIKVGLACPNRHAQ